MAKRHFSEKEVAQVLRRAGELQADSGTSLDGVSDEELLRMAGEIGIQPQHLERAILDLDRIDLDQGQTRWLGAPPAYEIERIVEGVVSDEDWQRMVGELNSTFHTGQVGTGTDPVRTWHHKHDTTAITVTATRGESTTRIKIVSYLDDGLGAGMVFAILGMVGTLGPFFALDELPLIARLAFPIILAPLIWLTFTRIVRNWYAKDRRKLNALANKLAGLAQGDVSPAPYASQVDESSTLDIGSAR